MNHSIAPSSPLSVYQDICIFYLKRIRFGYSEEYYHSVVSQSVGHCTRKLFSIPKRRIINDQRVHHLSLPFS